MAGESGGYGKRHLMIYLWCLIHWLSDSSPFSDDVDFCSFNFVALLVTLMHVGKCLSVNVLLIPCTFCPSYKWLIYCGMSEKQYLIYKFCSLACCCSCKWGVFIFYQIQFIYAAAKIFMVVMIVNISFLFIWDGMLEAWRFLNVLFHKDSKHMRSNSFPLQNFQPPFCLLRRWRREKKLAFHIIWCAVT